MSRRKLPKRRAYDTDLSDGQWALIAPLIPEAQPGGRPRKAATRELINAILYFLRGGAAWRLLPHHLPPWQTVYYYLRRWQREGVWDRVHHALVMADRERAGRQPSPSAAILDSQSVRTADQRMGRPICKWFVSAGLSSLHKRIRPSRRGGWPRWRSARPGPHKGAGVERHFSAKAFRTPIDCQAIFFSPPTDI